MFQTNISFQKKNFSLMHGNYPFSVDNSFGTEEVRRIPLSLSKEEQNKDPENLVTDTLKQVNFSFKMNLIK